jgi:hypothetical protein
MELIKAGTTVRVTQLGTSAIISLREVATQLYPDSAKFDTEFMIYLLFTKDAYVIGKKSEMVFEKANVHYISINQAREYISKPLGDNVRHWPRLKKACQLANLERVNIPHGQFPIHYVFETVVPDEVGVEGTDYFIIRKSEVGTLLDKHCPEDKEVKLIRQKRLEDKEENLYNLYAPTKICESVCGFIDNDYRIRVDSFLKLDIVSWEDIVKTIIFSKSLKYDSNVLTDLPRSVKLDKQIYSVFYMEAHSKPYDISSLLDAMVHYGCVSRELIVTSKTIRISTFSYSYKETSSKEFSTQKIIQEVRKNGSSIS